MTIALNLSLICVGKGKKKKGKKKAAKKKKGAKGKPLPGKKLCGNLDSDQMLQTLIEHGILLTPAEAKISDICGEYNYLGKVPYDP